MSGFKKVLSNRSYEGELSFVQSANKDSHTRDGTVCKVGSVVYFVFLAYDGCGKLHNY